MANTDDAHEDEPVLAPKKSEASKAFALEFDRMMAKSKALDRLVLAHVEERDATLALNTEKTRQANQRRQTAEQELDEAGSAVVSVSSQELTQKLTAFSEEIKTWQAQLKERAGKKD